MTPTQLVGLVLVILAIVGIIAVWTIVTLYLRRLDRPVLATDGGWVVDPVVAPAVVPAGSEPIVEREVQQEFVGWDDRAALEDDWFADEAVEVVERPAVDEETVVMPAEEAEGVDVVEEPVAAGGVETVEGDLTSSGDPSVSAHRGEAEAEELTTVVPAQGDGATAAGETPNDGAPNDGAPADGAPNDERETVGGWSEEDGDWAAGSRADETAASDDGWFDGDGDDGVDGDGKAGVGSGDQADEDPFAVTDQQTQPRKKRRGFGF